MTTKNYMPEAKTEMVAKVTGPSKGPIINGKTVHINDDWTILQACEKVGLFIPRFCYSESLSIAGNCRMCLVEIEKSPKSMPSRAVRTASDLRVHTKTNLVRRTRESILEFSLINHPLDCPICDQGGECDLQDQAMIYGSDRGRFYEYKRSPEDKNKGPLIKTLMTRCTHCTRCIRFATEIAGVEVSGTTGRGKSMEVGSYISSLSNSELSGNATDLCPVGALTSKPYAFIARQRELKSIESIDVSDGIGSSIRIDTRGSESMRILPRSNDDINQQWIPDKTRSSYDGLKLLRINYPMMGFRRSPGAREFINVSWKQVIPIVSEKIGTIANQNPNQTSGVIGQFIDEETIPTFKRFSNQLGVESSNIFIQDPGSKWNRNINIDFRANHPLGTKLNELEKEGVDFVLLLGSTPRHEASALNVRLRALGMKKNTSISSVGFPTDLTYPVDQLGTGLKTIYQLAHGKHSTLYQILKAKNPIIILGFNAYQREDGDVLKDTCDWILLRRREIICCAAGPLWARTNCLLRRHRGSAEVFSPARSSGSLASPLHVYASTPGAYDSNVGVSTRETPWSRRKWFQSQGQSSRQDAPRQECIYLLGADFEMNWDQAPRHRKSNGPCIIYQGHHGDIGARQADITLPSSSYVEKDGPYVNTEGRVQQSQAAIKPDASQTDIRDDWMILQVLSNILSSGGVANQTYQSNPKNDWLFYDGLSASLWEAIEGIQRGPWLRLEYQKDQRWAHSSGPENPQRSERAEHLFCFAYTEEEASLERVCFIAAEGCLNGYRAAAWEKSGLGSFTAPEAKSDRGSAYISQLRGLFDNIAPHLNQKSEVATLKEVFPARSYGPWRPLLAALDTRSNSIRTNRETLNAQQYTLYDTPFIPLFDNFYLTDPISRASITMGKCSTQFQSHNFPF